MVGYRHVNAQDMFIPPLHWEVPSGHGGAPPSSQGVATATADPSTSKGRSCFRSTIYNGPYVLLGYYAGL